MSFAGIQKTLIFNNNTGWHGFRMIIAVLVLISIPAFFCLTPAGAQQLYSEICDSSAAVAIDPSHFLVAHNEADVLYLYRNDGFAQTNGKSEPLKKFDLKSEL